MANYTLGIEHSTYKHGMSKHPVYKVWASMLQRCNNPRCKDYPNYGGRGITVCDEWASFQAFYTSLGSRPEGYTLERCNNEKDYEPTNCIWASRSVQSVNRRKPINKSGYTGVTRDKKGYGWIARVTIEGTRKYLGYSTCRHEAAMLIELYKEQLK